jgi:predicted TIM-barrel fold metal-dependent hydrolase
MDSPWGKLPVSDAHVHFFSHKFFAALAKQKGGIPVEETGALLGWQTPPPEPEKLAGHWIHEMDRFGVESAILIASVPADEDSVAAAVKRYPDRFYGYFMLNPLAEDAAGRVRSAIAGGLRGVCLFPAMHGYWMHDERVQAVLAAAGAQPGTVVFVHCGVLSVGFRTKLGLPCPFDLRYSNPIDLHNVALRHPNLNFVIPHFGAGYFREALMLCDLCPNVYLDTSSSNRWMRYLVEEPALRDVFRRALEVAGPKRLLFGTDSSFFPRGWHAEIFEEQAKALYELGGTEEQARLIFGENLRHLLR